MEIGGVKRRINRLLLAARAVSAIGARHFGAFFSRLRRIDLQLDLYFFPPHPSPVFRRPVRPSALGCPSVGRSVSVRLRRSVRRSVGRCPSGCADRFGDRGIKVRHSRAAGSAVAVVCRVGHCRGVRPAAPVGSSVGRRIRSSRHLDFLPGQEIIAYGRAIFRAIQRDFPRDLAESIEWEKNDATGSSESGANQRISGLSAVFPPESGGKGHRRNPAMPSIEADYCGGRNISLISSSIPGPEPGHNPSVIYMV